MTEPPAIVRYSMPHVDQAPDTPGLYAWYVSFRAGPHDWKLRAGKNGDEATEGFLNLLRKYAGYYEPLPINLSGRGSYGARWQGEIALDSPLGPPDGPDAPTSVDAEDDTEAEAVLRLEKLMGSLDTENRRRVMSTILTQAIPVFSSPLYIGVAENLKQRLIQHRQKFTRAHDYLREHPQDADAVRAHGRSFGERAAARNIAMEHLEAWVIDLGDEQNDEITKKQLRNTAESAEWLLHRLYSPILGRQ
ncbi:hypothetical protein ACGF5O_22045 [Streptomyces sp. NPDC048291]|uniref:hypothetical protein n=1 Tax=Streptomyces sp. NPDC048291 TaxID=3365530 RepID=UPI00371B5754